MDGCRKCWPVTGISILTNTGKVTCKESARLQVTLWFSSAAEFNLLLGALGVTGWDLQAKFGSDHSMVSPVFCHAHSSGYHHVLPVPLTDNDIIQ